MISGDLSAAPFGNHRGVIEWFLGSDGKQVIHMRDAEPQTLEGSLLPESSARYETIYSGTEASIRNFFAEYQRYRCNNCIIAVYWDSHHFQYMQLVFLLREKWFRLHFVQGGASGGSGPASVERVQCILEPVAVNGLTLYIVWNDRKKRHIQLAGHIQRSTQDKLLFPLCVDTASFVF